MKFSPAKLKSLVEKDPRLSKDIARLGGFSAPALSQWAKGDRTPGADELAALARAFHVPLEHFYDEAVVPKRFEIRELPAEYLVDDLIAEAQDIGERVKQLEMKAKKLKKPVDDIAARMAKRGIAAGDNPEVKPSSRKSALEEVAEAIEEEFGSGKKGRGGK